MYRERELEMTVTKVIVTRTRTNVRKFTTSQAIHNVVLFDFRDWTILASYRREVKQNVEDHTEIKWHARV